MKNSPSIPDVDCRNWVDLLNARVETHRAETAFVFLDSAGREAEALTYGELQQRAQAIAYQLTREVAVGDRALLLHPPGLDYVVSFYGCLYAGVIAVPLFPPQPNVLEQVDTIARDAEASILLSTGDIVRGIAEFDDKWYIAGLPRIASDAITEPPEHAVEVEITETDIAYLQYTSGSTSVPKGVIIQHGMMLHQCAELVYGWGVDTESVVVSWLPHFHDFGQVSSVLMPVFTGTKAVLMAPSTFVKNPIRWLSAVSTYRGTHSGSPNFAFDLCVDRTTPQQRAELDLSSWRLVSNGAEPVRKATLDRFRAAFEPHGLPPTAPTPGYGLAEATLKVTSGTSGVEFAATSFDTTALGAREVVPAGDAPGTELVGCGKAVMRTDIAIVTPESGQRAADGAVGEIWVSGPIVSPGYWNRPEDSERTFRARITGEDDARTYLRTGDLGFWYAGELYICGRVKNLMIVNGVNYYLEDIETTVVNGVTSLRAGAVIAFSVERDDQENLVLVAEYRADAGPSPQELVTAVHDAVARKHAIVPVAIVFIGQGTIARTTSGKLRRQQCKSDFLAGALAEVHRWEGMVTIETSADTPMSATPSMRELVQQGLLTQIQEWMAENLGPDGPRLDSARSLAEHGLGSVDQMNLHDRLETWSGKRFPPELMWEATSIAAMTRIIADHLTPAVDDVVSAPQDEDPTGVRSVAR